MVLYCLAVNNFDFTNFSFSFYGKKIRENTLVLHCLDVDNFDFTKKI